MLFLLPNTPSHVHILNPLPNPSPCLKLESVIQSEHLAVSLLQHKFAAPPLPPPAGQDNERDEFDRCRRQIISLRRPPSALL